ncbi:MAG: TPM domain-containing protein [Bacteroidales bacterium]|nr:TPM domain-containing protein [Bacteroidaceae bacterium]MEE0235456.1 TPM domain-containing protein [Bacteroidales bacterium]
MRSHTKYILVLLCLMTAVLSYAIPSRPDPQRLVNDLAQVFTSDQVSRLENTLVAFDDSTSNQIVVVTVKDLEGYDPSEYATRIGLDWGVGSAQFNNGIVLLVKPKTYDSAGQVFIAVGYGLEGAIPDAYAKRIIENELIPNFRLNDYYAGVEAACDVLMKLASGEISEPRGEEEDDALLEIIATLLFIGLLIFIFIIAIGQNDDNGHSSGGGRRTIYVGPIITSGRSYGGGSSFGGGFGGGFGGFGGGSFGGGGAGGSW